MFDLNNKKVLITGAGGGIGAMLAQSAERAGAELALIDCDASRLNALALDAQHLRLTADISDATQINAAIDQAHESLGRIDGLVNCAAILLPDDTAPHTTPLASWNTTLATNLTGTFLACQAVLTHMLAQARGGAIVNLSSIVAHLGSAQAQIAYTTAKGGIEAMTREIAICYARQNIRANLVAPGPVKTSRTAHYFDTDEKWTARRAHIPLGRLGNTDEIAGLIMFLLSDAASYMTASTYFVDGGIHAAYLVDDANGQDTP